MLAGNVLGTPAVKTLAERWSQIAGIKDSGGDLTVLNDLLIGRRADFSVVTGIDTLVLPGLLAGSRFWLAMGLGSFPAPVKAAMELLGLPAGAPRRPIAPLAADQREKLRQQLQEMQVL
jgi:4-hydroxy-tetrahydrodipicolinate synthase